MILLVTSCDYILQVVQMLDTLYRCFDETIAGYDMYTVQTIGDVYMVASGE